MTSLCNRCDEQVLEVRSYQYTTIHGTCKIDMCIDCWQALAISSDAKVSILKDTADQYKTLIVMTKELVALEEMKKKEVLINKEESNL